MDKKEILANSLIHKLVVDTFDTEDYIGYEVTKVEDGKVDIKVYIDCGELNGCRVETIKGIYPIIDFVELQQGVNPIMGTEEKRISLKVKGVKTKGRI